MSVIRLFYLLRALASTEKRHRNVLVLDATGLNTALMLVLQRVASDRPTELPFRSFVYLAWPLFVCTAIKGTRARSETCLNRWTDCLSRAGSSCRQIRQIVHDQFRLTISVPSEYDMVLRNTHTPRNCRRPSFLKHKSGQNQGFS